MDVKRICKKHHPIAVEMYSAKLKSVMEECSVDWKIKKGSEIHSTSNT